MQVVIVMWRCQRKEVASPERNVGSKMDSERLASIRHWGARFRSVGVPESVLDDVVERLQAWSDWPALWREEAVKESAHAEREQQAGHLLTAGESWSRAALYFHFAQFILFDDDELRRELTVEKVQAHARALPMLPCAGSRLEIPTEAGRLYAVARWPDDPQGAQVPTVIILPGADSAKEEYVQFENLLLSRGLATVSIDGPGQGESRFGGADWRFDYEVAFPSVVEAVQSMAWCDQDSVGLMGFSFGAYLAPRVAAQCADLRAAVSLGGCFDLSYWDDLPPLLKDDIAYLFSASSLDEARAWALEKVSLADVLPRIRGALLVVHGTDDRIFQHEDAWKMKKLKPDTDVVVFEGGDHGCHNRSHHAKPLIVDWLADSLSS